MTATPEQAFTYLVDPRNRPKWQSSLLSVDVPDDEEPHLGQAWSELTAVGVRPHLVVTEFVPYRVWAESGTWRGVRADLRLRFTARGTGCRVQAEGEVSGSGLYAAAALSSGLVAGRAIGADLRKAGRLIAAQHGG
ncbi:SRPBCC family protein [Nocardioides okcheonensis]|nr:SRPBCC family protein [Nocardioides okcheonensis]